MDPIPIGAAYTGNRVEQTEFGSVSMAYVIYTIQPTDRIRGLHGLARWLYGHAERWVDLYHANRGVIGDDPIALRPGQQLVVPYDPDHDQLCITLYVVQAADYGHGLVGIALNHYCDPSYAELLYHVNRGVIGEDPSYLQAGQVLIIPQIR